MTAFLPSQADFDPVKNILEWRSQQLQVQPNDYVEETHDDNVVASLSASLTSLFKAIIPALSLPEQDQDRIPQTARISLERSCSALILWSDGYGIAEGRLNDTLSRSRKLRYTTLKNLLHIGRVLVERLVPLVHVSEKLQEHCSSVESNIEEAAGIIIEASSRRSDESSSDAASDFSNDDIHEIAEDLKTDTLVLSSLDPLLKCPIFDTQYNDAANGLASSTWSPEKLFSSRIEHRFPSAGTPLASRLGRVNYERYLRCQAMRDAQQSEEPLSMMIQEVQGHASKSIADSRFHGFGVGTSPGASIAPTSYYVGITTSYSHKGQSLRIPPLSKEAQSGLPFTCVACGRTVVVTNNTGWKRHIYLDLQPYMCLDMSCPYSSNTFESREEWIGHLALDHEMAPQWDSTRCALCREQTGRGKVAVTMHLAKHLEEISLSALPIGIASDAASTDNPEPTDISFFSECSYGRSVREPEPLSVEIDATATNNRHNVQDAHDLKSPDPRTETKNRGTPSDDKVRHLAAAQGDLATEAPIFQAKDSFDDPEATEELLDTSTGVDRHIEKAKDYHRFLATAKKCFKNQPDKYARFLDNMAVILCGPCRQCLGKTVCDSHFPTTCGPCHFRQVPCVFTVTTTHEPIVVSQIVSNIGLLFGGYPSFVTRELNNLLFLHGYLIEAIDHSRVRFFAPNTESVIIQAVQSAQSEASQRQRTSEHSAVDRNDEPKRHIDYIELRKAGLFESWVTKVKDRFVGSPHVYRQLLEILQDTQDDARSTQNAPYLAVKKLLGVNKDLVEEFQILVTKIELKLDGSLLQRARSVLQYGTESPEGVHIDRGGGCQGSNEAAEVDDKGKSTDSTQILCYICHEVGSGEMIQCDYTDSCQGKWFHLTCVRLSTTPAATVKWHCPECRGCVDIAEVEEPNPGVTGEEKLPSCVGIDSAQANPGISMWTPESDVGDSSYYYELLYDPPREVDLPPWAGGISTWEDLFRSYKSPALSPRLHPPDHDTPEPEQQKASGQQLHNQTP